MKLRVRLTWRRVVAAVAVIAMVVVAALFAGGWYFATVLDADGLRIDNAPDEFNLTVADIGNDRIVLRGESAEDLEKAGIWGLAWQNGYGRLEEVIESWIVPAESSSADTRTLYQVTRKFTLIEGVVETGDEARMDRGAFPPDPMRAHGYAFDEVQIAGPLGEMPAWLVPADSDTWAIMVHGRTANRDEALRLLRTTVEQGLPTLVITYRNDAETVPDPSGRYRFGLTEWEDLEAAVEFAVGQGAERVILAGFSMGGGIVVNFLYESELADRVTAVVLDAPMLDFGRTVDLGAEERGVSGVITWAAKQISSIRYDVDWGSLNYLNGVDRLQIPVLLFHGTEDTTVPVSTSQELARLRPDVVLYHEFEGADHVGAWNIDQDRYEAAVRAFLEDSVSIVTVR